MARFGPLTHAGAAALIVVLAGGSATADAATARASDAALATTQLPRGIRPLHYDVALVPHAATLTFEGRATVTIDMAAPTRRITLNAVGLAFSSVRLLPASGPFDRRDSGGDRRRCRRPDRDVLFRTANPGRPPSPGDDVCRRDRHAGER